MADQSNETGMVERVAVALYEAETSDLMDNWYSATQSLQDIYRRQARAALRAVRYCKGPLPDPLDAGIDAALSHDEVKG